EILAAPALICLLRRYIETGRDDLRDAVEPALARALEPGATGHDRAEWLTLFAEAARASADERLREAAADLTAALRQDWGRADAVGPRSRRLLRRSAGGQTGRAQLRRRAGVVPSGSTPS